MRYRVEVLADSSGQWCSNAVRYDSYEEAAAAAQDLQSRWTAVRQWRVVNETQEDKQ